MIHTVDGYKIIQDPENHHIMLYDSDGEVMHAACERPLNKNEPQGMVRNYLKILKKAVQRDNANHCVQCGSVIPEGQISCKKCTKNPCNECVHENDDSGYCLECYMGERWRSK